MQSITDLSKSEYIELEDLRKLTTKELHDLIIIRLRDAGYNDYISTVEIYTHKVYADAQKDAEDGCWAKINNKAV